MQSDPGPNRQQQAGEQQTTQPRQPCAATFLPHRAISREHAANNYIARILKAGRKVAICDPLEETRPGKFVKREVKQLHLPGTHFDERMLVAERNNFPAAVCPAGRIFHGARRPASLPHPEITFCLPTHARKLRR